MSALPRMLGYANTAQLFYNKSSQLVCGEEGTTESIALGRAVCLMYSVQFPLN